MQDFAVTVSPAGFGDLSDSDKSGVRVSMESIIYRGRFVDSDKLPADVTNRSRPGKLGNFGHRLTNMVSHFEETPDQSRDREGAVSRRVSELLK